MKEFFENLKETRIRKGIRLEDIARRTRLPLKYLKAIEEGRLEELPSGYNRIFFKRYLKEIGEDTPEIWHDFNLFFGAPETPAASDEDKPSEETAREPVPPEEPEKVSIPSPRPHRPRLPHGVNLDRWYRYFWIAVTIVLIGVVGYFAYQQYVLLKNTRFEVKEITVSDFIEELQEQDSLLTPKLSGNTVSRSQQAGAVKVELRALQRTWIREIRDSRDTTDYIMSPGLKRQIEAAQSVQLLLGRADGVDIWLNGKDLGVMGNADEVVVRLVLTPEGIAEKRIRKSRKKAQDTTRTSQSPSTTDSTTTQGGTP